MLPAAIDACKAAGFDLVVVETPGIGQGDAGIVPFSDVSLYVMTPEFGAASQLEKIDMFDFADAVAINKFDRRGGADALRDVGVRWRASGPRCRCSAPSRHASTTTASPPCTSACVPTSGSLQECSRRCRPTCRPVRRSIVPPARERYLAEIAETVRGTTRRRTSGSLTPAVASTCSPRRTSSASTSRSTFPSVTRCSTSGPTSSVRSSGEDARIAVGDARCREWRLPRFEDDGELAAVPPQRERPRPVPVHRRRVPVQARRTKIRRGCSRAKVARRVPTADSTSWPRVSRRRVCRPPSTRSRCTASIPTSVPTSTARSGTRACRSRRSTT